MVWLKNYERVQEIQRQIMWQPIAELEPRTFIPEVCHNKFILIKNILSVRVIYANDGGDCEKINEEYDENDDSEWL